MPVYKATYHVFGDRFPDMNLRFVDRNTYFTWHFAVEHVKDLSTSVRRPTTRREDFQPFMDGVRALRARWGGILVPEDVKSALKDVEERLNLPLTQWEEAERYQEGTVVDATHFGPFADPAAIYVGTFYG